MGSGKEKIKFSFVTKGKERIYINGWKMKMKQINKKLLCCCVVLTVLLLLCIPMSVEATETNGTCG